ncbi:UNVERIFIED_CONTAM: hypothetical protein FKN15_051054 [Acipenser sinensis]
MIDTSQEGRILPNCTESSREQKLKKEAPKSSEEDVSKCIRKRKNKASENMKEQQKENGDEAREEEDDPFWLTTLALRISLAYGLQTILSDYPSCLFARIWSRRSRLFFNLTFSAGPIYSRCPDHSSRRPTAADSASQAPAQPVAV